MDGFKKLVVVLALAAIFLALTAPAVAQKQAMPVSSKTMMPMETSGKNTMSTVMGMKDTSMVASVIKDMGMDKTMAGAGKHTLFVPNDAAVQKIGMDKINVMKKDKAAAMKAMQGLVTTSTIKPSDMVDGKKLTMMNGKTMTVSAKNGQTMIDGAKVVKAVQTTDGMIYVIDTMPSTVTSMMGTMAKK